MSKEEQSVPDQESDEKEMYLDTTEYKLIYIYWIDDNVHKGLLKIGDASLRSPKTFDCFPNNCSELNKAARKRIGEQTGTAGIMYHLCHTEIAVKKKGQYIEAFRDKAVHKVLENSGIKKMIISVPGGRATEWFQVNLDTAKNAIAACKQGRQTLLSSEIVPEEEREIILREEQEDAIKKTIACFKDNSQMLWNAKMRYGKTATSLTFVKRELKKYPKTIIITHRPVV
ncbi:MAG: DEAD/DEAH box helicase, partial [Candidatus Cloacimonetes bacterium]|nr:DEAD/DEAH box helicase [Candidatus Cloacimonadota bacterium]